MNEPKTQATKSVVDQAIADKLAVETAQKQVAFQRDAEFAEARQKELLRKVAPGGLKIGVQWEDPMMDVIRTHCEPFGIKVMGKAPINPRTGKRPTEEPIVGGEGATHSTYTDSPKNHQKTLSLGYIPLLNRLTNEQVRNGDDLVYYRDKRISDAVIRDAALRSKELLGAPHAGMADAGRTEGLRVLQDETIVSKGTLAGT